MQKTDNETDVPRASRKALYVLLFLTGLILFVTMPKWIYVGDSISVRAASIRLLTNGELNLPFDFVKSFGNGERGAYYCENPESGKWFSKYGVFTTLIFVPPLWVEQITTGRLPMFSELDAAGLERRCLILNSYNILLSLLLAGYLYFTAIIYFSKPRQAAAYVLVVFFGTFLWYYLRAQTVEIFQVLFFTAAYFHLIRADRYAAEHGPEGRYVFHALMVSVFVVFLSLQKSVFVLLMPLTAVFLVLAGFRRSDGIRVRDFVTVRMRSSWKPLLVTTVFPFCIAIGLIAVNNTFCFGSPFLSGYHQWERFSPIFSQNIEVGLFGFLFSPRKSIFLYFPVFAISLAGLIPFAKRYPFDFALSWISFGMFYVFCSTLIFWGGDWCLGPRYLLFVLPVLSLSVSELIPQVKSRKGGRQIFIAAGIVLLFWVGMNQVLVQSFEFFAPFRAERPFENVNDPEVRAYFKKPFWTINRDLLFFRMGRSGFPPLDRCRSLFSENEMNLAERELKSIPLNNYYWIRSK